LQLGQTRQRLVTALESQQALHQIDDRVQRGVLVVRRAAGRKAQGVNRQNMGAQHVHQARLADAGLAAEADHLPGAFHHLRPAVLQQRDFAVSPHQSREPLIGGGIEAAGGFAHSDDAITAGVWRDPLERQFAQILIVEAASGQPAHLLAHHHAPGLRDALQPGGEIRRVADHRILLRAR
jgi:hypothetical protein